MFSRIVSTNLSGMLLLLLGIDIITMEIMIRMELDQLNGHSMNGHRVSLKLGKNQSESTL